MLSISVLDFGSSAAEHYQLVISQKIRVGTQDLKVAAVEPNSIGFNHY
jgi:hypothetical protein